MTSRERKVTKIRILNVFANFILFANNVRYEYYNNYPPFFLVMHRIKSTQFKYLVDNRTGIRKSLAK